MIPKLRKAFSLRFYLKKLLELRDRPEETARGLALGVFIGFLPINGFQVLVAITIAALTKVSKVAAAIGTHVTNPWTTIPILLIDYYVGCLILGRRACLLCFRFEDFHSVLSYGLSIIVPMFIGGVVLGTVFSILSYIGFKNFLSSLKRLKEQEL